MTVFFLITVRASRAFVYFTTLNAEFFTIHFELSPKLFFSFLSVSFSYLTIPFFILFNYVKIPFWLSNFVHNLLFDWYYLSIRLFFSFLFVLTERTCKCCIISILLSKHFVTLVSCQSDSDLYFTHKR